MSTEEGTAPNVIGVACTYILTYMYIHVFSKDTCTRTGICTGQKLRSGHHPSSTRGPTMREQREPHRPETEGTRLPEALVHLDLLVSPHD